MNAWILTLWLACAQETDDVDLGSADENAVWEALAEEDLYGDESDKEGDTGKSDACGPEVVEGEPCEGDWTVTLCVDDEETWWWCEGGVWVSDK